MHMRRFLFYPVVFPIFSTAQNTDAELDKNIAEIKPEVINWRRYLHQHPELSNREYNTAAYVAAYLKNSGLRYRPVLAKQVLLVS